MSVVYRALDTRLQRRAALKFLPPEWNLGTEAKQRLLQEAQAASALEHPNICTIYEIDEAEEGQLLEKGQLFLVMPYYEGETLKQKIARGGALPTRKVLGYAIQMARGLSKAHAAGIVHRDLKPANVFVTEQGLVKVLDFGLAKAADYPLTEAGQKLGTAAYMSPEQVRSEEVDARTDIWSLGVVLYEMLTGRLPFPGEYELAIFYRIQYEDPEPLQVLVPGVPEELGRVVGKALAKDVEKRYASMGEVLEELRILKRGRSRPEAESRPEA